MLVLHAMRAGRSAGGRAGVTPPMPDLLSAGRHCQEKGRRDGLAEGHRSISARASERREVATSAI